MSDTGSSPPRCRCGFWGSSQTMNLCSKCYKDEIKSKDGSNSLTELSKGQEVVTKLNENFLENKDTEKSREDEKSVKVTATTTEVATTSYLPEDRPVQKNKKKCWNCQAKLELAQRELGKCRCGYVYCQLHRLPEKHDCVYNHKESGRDEARQKMVPAGPKKVGRSFQRMDE